MRTTLVLAGVVAIGGCGGNGGSIPIDELPGRVEATYCRVLVSCSYMPDEATCREAFDLAGGMGTTVAAVKRGTATYDGQLAAQCLGAFPSDCTARPELPFNCSDMLMGTVPAGGSCVQGIECAGRAECMKPPGCGDACCVGSCADHPMSCATACPDGTTCDGSACVPTSPVGASCTTSSACTPPALCSFPVGSWEGGVCASPAASGAACDPTRTLTCVRPDDYCDTTTGTCTRRHAAGAACSSSDECAGDAPCKAGTCVAASSVGGPCGDDVHTCLGMLVCSGGVCAAPPAPAVCSP
jgi:hypothetical protein